SSRRRHTRFSRDWSSDVCSSDLGERAVIEGVGATGCDLPEGFGQGGIAQERADGKGAAIGVVIEGAGRGILPQGGIAIQQLVQRSEERRVGKECRWRWAPRRENT